MLRSVAKKDKLFFYLTPARWSCLCFKKSSDPPTYGVPSVFGMARLAFGPCFSKCSSAQDLARLALKENSDRPILDSHNLCLNSDLSFLGHQTREPASIFMFRNRVLEDLLYYWSLLKASSAELWSEFTVIVVYRPMDMINLYDDSLVSSGLSVRNPEVSQESILNI